MFSCRLYFIFVVVTILCIHLCVGISSHTKTCSERDKQALLKLKDGFIIIHGRDTLSSWNGTGDCCKWEGISCNNLTGRVTRLRHRSPYLDDFPLRFGDEELELNNLSDVMHQLISNAPGALGGKIDSSICELRHLTFIDLSLNKLEGEIPKCIGSLRELIELNLASNELVGSIPHTFANLSNLQNLDLSLNFLVPSDLKCLSHLSNLRYLGLSYNDLSRAIDWPLSTSKIPFLSMLSLDYCELPQVNPKSTLHINSSSSLQMLTMSGNKFNSSILPWVLNVSKVRTSQDLSPNSLNNSVSDGFANTNSLRFLDLSYNHLDGSLIKSFETLCQLKNLNYLSLEYNPFSSGPLPDFSLLSSLKWLFLANTNIVGPLSFDLLLHLENLDLSFNNLRSIPEFEVTKYASLIVLRLHGNKIEGSIPTSLCNLSFLQVLDLSSNNISGQIPQCLSHITALSNVKFPRKIIFYGTSTFYADKESEQSSFVHQLTLEWKALNRKYGKILRLVTLTVIDLSGNHLTGEIPQNLTKLTALLALNLSGNNLTGFIPYNIGDMKWLELLDLSRNHLSGRMPSSFSNLRFLSYMDLSFNNLSGEVPVGTQLQTFDASAFIGNIGLCGPPLTDQCPSDVVPRRGVDKNGTNDEEDELINIGFYISLALGFYAGFWSVCGTLILKDSWRHAYFRFFNNMSDWIYVTIVVFVARMKRRFKIQ